MLQYVTPETLTASRRWTLTGAFWQWFGCAPVGVEPLEVRFAHPVRLSPDTHSQGKAAEKDIGIESP